MEAKGMWIIEPSFKQRHMIIELDETDDGRLVADGLTRDDAQRAVRAVNTRGKLLASLRTVREKIAPLGSNAANECVIIIDAALRVCDEEMTR